MDIHDIVANLSQRGDTGRPVLIAIEGYGGAGKTTFARQLMDALGDAHIVSIDDFIVKEKLTDPSWDNGTFDLERLEKQVLLPASRGLPVSYQRLEWETNTLSDPVMVPAVGYLIVEGIASYHPSIEHYYDCRIWIDTPLEIAQKRGHARDGSNENAGHWDLWARNDIAYQQKYHPEKRADYVL